MKPKKLARVALGLEEKAHGSAAFKDPFARRNINLAVFALLFALLSWWSAGATRFSFFEAIESFPKALIWLMKNFIPNADALDYLPDILGKLLETVVMSVVATVLAAVLAFFLALLASKSTRPHPVAAFAIRGIATVFRTIPLVAWAMIFLFSFGQSTLTGLLAIFVETFGFLIRAFAEAIDETSGSSVEALRASGASWSQTMAQSVLPSVLPQLISWVLYMIETNIRSATLIGILTGTGIGFAFNLYYKSMRYAPAALVVLVIVLAVLLIERISNTIRREIL